MNVGTDTINVLSLCTGGGGLDLGLKLASDAFRVVCCVEHEAYCCEVLASRMEEKALDDAPIWTDLRTCDGRAWRGIVDLVTAGYPCQPFSCAGKRKGEDDPRHLWPHVRRIAEECQPELLFLENVPGHLNLGFDSVLSDLRAMGYEVAAGLFTAAEVGASHRRQRLFILAHCPNLRGSAIERSEQDGVLSAMADSKGTEQQELPQGDSGGASEAPQQERPLTGASDRSCPRHTAEGTTIANGTAATVGSDVADASNRRHQEGAAAFAEEDGSADTQRDIRELSRRLGRSCGNVANARGKGLQGAGSTWSFRGRELISLCGDRAAVPLFPPSPGAIDLWREILEVAPSLEPAIRGVADGLAPRVDRLRMLGNGVVPLQAAYAFVSLAACLLGEA